MQVITDLFNKIFSCILCIVHHHLTNSTNIFILHLFSFPFSYIYPISKKRERECVCLCVQTRFPIRFSQHDTVLIHDQSGLALFGSLDWKYENDGWLAGVCVCVCFLFCKDCVVINTKQIRVLSGFISALYANSSKLLPYNIQEMTLCLFTHTHTQTHSHLYTHCAA